MRADQKVQGEGPSYLFFAKLPERQIRRYEQGLREALPGIRLSFAGEAEEAGRLIPDAEVLMAFGPALNDRLIAAGRRLKWIQALGTGVDGIVDQPSLGPEVIISNMRGIHGPPMAEAALSAMLCLARSVPRLLRNQGQQRWDRFASQTLSGSTLAIVGSGSIAAYLAPICKALGMTVLGISAAPRPVPGFDHMYSRKQAGDAVARADFVLLLVPSTHETRNLVDGAFIERMKRTAFLINLARGSVVHEAALLAALQQGRIAGAYLDTFVTEPLPPGHPFWQLDNVVIAPHAAGMFNGYADAALPILVENIRLYQRGATTDMINLVRHP
ncbi:MAG: D-2-hydroxyacid dehydrogenase [Pigmentiphaga sp.]|jgi:phosphoglycerate dehydrogenase-like enzyme|uniref:D-2-hydroxyacid dehydrogenase n=1 Tax=Pigmentiphaga daeguensis TaxID=414049 RepID=A0ABN1D3X5_9BURK|nr:D-2-hydroxyacid dehydrogenase [Pigmentiphaga sp. NML030171]OVZ66518.1 hypothetical protein CDO46_00275 [Pigmentiphaga sp. NML030171]